MFLEPSLRWLSQDCLTCFTSAGITNNLALQNNLACCPRHYTPEAHTVAQITTPRMGSRSARQGGDCPLSGCLPPGQRPLVADSGGCDTLDSNLPAASAISSGTSVRYHRCWSPSRDPR